MMAEDVGDFRMSNKAAKIQHDVETDYAANPVKTQKTLKMMENTPNNLRNIVKGYQKEIYDIHKISNLYAKK